MSSCNIIKSSSDHGSSGASSEDGAEEEEEQEESSSNLKESNVDDTLENFRKHWQKEIQTSPKNQPNKPSVKALPAKRLTDDDVFNEATVMFKKGVEHERTGKLYEAIQFYRRAIQLVPDIEFKLEEQSLEKSQDHSDSEDFDEITYSKKQNAGITIENDEYANADFLLKIQRRLSKCSCMCLPEFEHKSTHISSLPMEIILYILRWVVSSELDMRSLEMCARVCRGFYLCARDSEIWRLACVRTWGLSCSLLPAGNYLSWRQMFLERPRILFNGCYISKTSYTRNGENSFQDQYYRPWHLVTYYRYIRFFPDGVVLMLTSSEEPVQCLSLLRNRSCRNPAVLTGRYRYRDGSVSMVLHRQERTNKHLQLAYKRNKRRDAHGDAEQTFHIELQIQNQLKRRSAQLTWLGYSVFTRSRNGTESNCSFDIVQNSFPALWFSRVKSYTAESDGPLE